MALSRYVHTGAAPATGLASGITSSATSFTVLSGTGYPSPAAGQYFVVCIDAGATSEEKILCSARSGTTFTVASGGRGYDGTTAASHSSGTTNVTHVLSAAEVDDTSDHIYTTTRDDHTQYARTDGTRAFTGGITVSSGGAAITGNSTVTGTLTSTGTLTGNLAAMGWARLYLSAANVGLTSGQTQITGNTASNGGANAPTITTADEIIATKTGLYLVTVNLGIGMPNQATTDGFFAYLYLNGSAVRTWGAHAREDGSPAAVGGTDIISLSANDVLTYYASGITSAGMQVETGSNTTWLSAALLGV